MNRDERRRHDRLVWAVYLLAVALLTLLLNLWANDWRFDPLGYFIALPVFAFIGIFVVSALDDALVDPARRWRARRKARGVRENRS